MKKKIYLIIIIFISILLSIGVNKSKAVDNESYNETIYALNESITTNYGIEIPTNVKTSFNILDLIGERGPFTYTITWDGMRYYYLTIDENGNVSGKKTSSGTYEYHTYVIEININDKTYNVTVNLKNYLDLYSDEIIDDYLSKNIKSNMTEYQKMQKICEFVCQYNYGTSPSYQGMIATGGGDCWASSYCIIAMCDKIGIQSHLRYGVNEPGAGGGHRNVSALLDGEVYVIEAGFDEKAPRHYSIKAEPGGFYFAWNSDDTNTAVLIQYDGFEKDVVVPSEYEGDPVTTIGEKAFQYAALYSGVQVNSVTLPDTITRIRAKAFGECEELTTINIPAGVSEIQPTAFEHTSKLKNIIMSSENPYYTMQDNIIYNKDKTEVVAVATTISGSVKLDDNVKIIDECAFAYTTNLDAIELGNQVEKINKKAFYKSKLKAITIPKSVKKIYDSAFEACGLYFCRIEDGCEAEIGTFAFNSNKVRFEMIIPSSITTISRFMTNGAPVIYGETGSAAETYANDKKGTFIPIDSDSANKLYNGMICLSLIEYDYCGKEIMPDVLVADGKKILKEGQDYLLTVTGNLNAGTAKVNVTGINNYNGQITQTFKIKKIDIDFDFICEDITYGQQFEPKVLVNSANASVSYSYAESLNASVWTVKQFTEVGTYYISARANTTVNTNPKTIKKEIHILPADNILKIKCDNIIEGAKPSPTILENASAGNVTYYYKVKGAADSTYTTQVPTALGNYTVKAVSVATSNYKEGTTTADFSILQTLPDTVIKGDVNGDGKINLYDALQILRKAILGGTLTDEEKATMDINGDGKVNLYDAIQVLKKAILG